jgi:hypothetical protein
VEKLAEGFAETGLDLRMAHMHIATTRLAYARALPTATRCTSFKTLGPHFLMWKDLDDLKRNRRP